MLKDVRTRYTNQPKAKVFFLELLAIRKLGVDVEHEEAERLSPFASRSCVRQVELTKRKVDEMRADFF